MGTYQSTPSSASTSTTFVCTPEGTPMYTPPGVPERTRIQSLVGDNSTLVDAQSASVYSDLAKEVQLIEGGHANGFITAITYAFKNHQPLVLRPQHIWLLILQGVATHVRLHSADLAEHWTKSAESKTFTIVRDSFLMNMVNDWAGMIEGPPDSFLAQIRENAVDDKLMDDLVPSFSNTTSVEMISLAATVMDICQPFFNYRVETRCGFPSITLEGSEEDWLLLSVHAEKLIAQRCMPDFAKTWLLALTPLLTLMHAQYVESAAGRPIHATFWNSMCKLGGTHGSGARTYFNGWFNILFPYIRGNQLNMYCVPWSPTNGYVQEGLVWGGTPHANDLNSMGPDCLDFPTGIGMAPVTWEHYDKGIPLEFHSGFIGAAQDPNTLAITPHMGWFIRHKPKEQAKVELGKPNAWTKALKFDGL